MGNNPLKITSQKNPKLKSVLQLRDRKGRREQNRFLVEGAREISRAMASGYNPKEFFYCPAFVSSEAEPIIAAVLARPDVGIYEIEEAGFQKIAVRESKDGIFGVFEYREQLFSSLNLPKIPLLLVAENIEKPGNIGAMIRSADGVGADAVVLLGRGADPFSPNVIRASLGTVFSVPVILSTVAEFRRFVEARNIRCFAAALALNAVDYSTADLSGPSAVLFGSEANGLTQEALSLELEVIQIPMAGIADSLNVSVAAAVILYEARRQRAVNVPSKSS
jgi:TrmH family RNA methyltransferase